MLGIRSTISSSFKESFLYRHSMEQRFGGNIWWEAVCKAMVRSSARVILVNVIIFIFPLGFGLKPRTFSCCLEKGMNTCQYVSCICVDIWHSMFYIPVTSHEDFKLVAPLLSANF